MYVEILVAGEHGGEVCAGPVVENMHGDTLGLCIGKLVTYA